MRRIDGAEKVSGALAFTVDVVAVLTASDLGLEADGPDQPLALRRAFHVGQPVAAVIAEAADLVEGRVRTAAGGGVGGRGPSQTGT